MIKVASLSSHTVKYLVRFHTSTFFKPVAKHDAEHHAIGSRSWTQFVSKVGWSFPNMAVILRPNLFSFRDLDEWRVRTLRHDALDT